MDIKTYATKQHSTAMYLESFEELLFNMEDDSFAGYNKNKKARYDLEDRYALGYAALGLTGEAGEIANKIKKYMRGEGDLNKVALIDELGDVCWYLFELCHLLEVDFASVLAQNAEKLRSRQERGVIQGDGDER